MPGYAHLVIRGRHVGPGANDLGFVRGPDGAFHALVGVMEQRTRGWHGPYDQAWLGRLAAAYAVRQLAAQYQAKGLARDHHPPALTASSSSSRRGEPMPRLRLRIHPTGHLEVQVEGMTDDGCHALVDEAASRVGVILERRPLPPASRSRRRRQRGAQAAESRAQPSGSRDAPSAG